MNRKLKALGLTLMATLALSALAASGASAAGEQFHAEVDHAVLDASGGLQTFTTTVGELTCEKVTGDATIAEKVTTTSEITATGIVYSGNCKRSDGVKTDIDMKHCDYLFTSEKSGTHAPVHIKCENVGEHIAVNATILGSLVACVKVPPQTPTGGGVTYDSNGSGSSRTVTITATVTGIEYTEVGACGKNTVANDGTYTGSVTITGTNTGGAQVGIWWQ